MKVIIYGTGKQAELASYFFKFDSPYEVIAFSLEPEFMDIYNTSLLGLPIVSLDDILHDYSPSDFSMHIAIGENHIREKVFKVIKGRGFTCVSYICSKAQTWNDLEIGENVFIDQGARIHPFVKIASNTIIIGSDIGHHCVIGKNVLISCARIGGNVTVGDNSFVGMNAGVKEHVTIGRQNIIGAGAFIGNNTEDNAVFSSHYSRKKNLSAEEIILFR